MKFCPLYTNKQVFDGFNEIIESLGGRPMTVEEFKSADLRNLRSGLDYSAMEATYKIYDRNNGNFIDFAPNGERSILFQDIFNLVKDRKKAIAIKANIYGETFLKKLNWISEDIESKDVLQHLDINREPLISFLLNKTKETDALSEILSIRELAIKDGRIILKEDGTFDYALAPNGKRSNLTEKLWLQVRTKAFKKWFGDWEAAAFHKVFTSSEAYKELEKYANDGDGVHAKLIRFFIDNFKNDIETYIPRFGSGMFRPDSKEILFPKYEWGKEGGERDYLQARKVALHELVHSITAHLLVGYYVAKDKKYEKELREVGYKGSIPKLSEVQIKAFNKLVEIKKKVSKYFDEHPEELNNTTPFENNTYYRHFENDYNGLELDEFISEAFSNPTLQAVMAKIPSSENSKKTIFDTVLELLGKIFNIKGTLFEDFINAANDALDTRYINNNLVSKVVDENGEPLVVYHGSLIKGISTFKGRIMSMGESNGMYFTSDINYAKNVINIKNAYNHTNEKGSVYSVFLNIRNPKQHNSIINSEMLEAYMYDLLKANKNKEKQIDGYIGHDKYDGWQADNIDWQAIIPRSKGTEFVVFNPNQIKSATDNNGEFSTENNDIRKIKAVPVQDDEKIKNIIDEFGLDSLLTSTNLETFFSTSLYVELNGGNLVSSKDLLEHLIFTKQISPVNYILAVSLSKHDVPILFGKNEFGEPMRILQKNGGSVIIIDPVLILLYMTVNCSNMLLHEVTHALTSDAIDNPKTNEEILFAIATSSIYRFFDKLIPETTISRDDSLTGAYILSDKHEFASEFATNERARQLLYEASVRYDIENNGKALLKIKKFVNAFTNLLLNRKVFKLKQDEFNNYKKLLNNFLSNRRTIIKGNITDLKMFQAVYSQIDKDVIDRQIAETNKANITRYINGFTSHSVRTTPELKPEERKALDLLELRSNLASALNTRILAVTTSKLSEEDKIRYKNTAKSLIDMLTNKKLKSVIVLSRLVEQILPQLIEDLDELRQMKETDDSYYMYQRHDNFGTYYAILDQIALTLSNPDYLLELKTELKEATALDKLGAVNSISALLKQVSSASNVTKSAIGYLDWILLNNLKRRMGVIMKDTNSTEIEKWLDEMKSIGYDSSRFIMTVGAKDGSSDTTVRAILYMINKANRSKEKALYPKICELVNLLGNLKDGESLRDIYEYDGDNATANMVRKLNYGKQKREYKEALKKINALYGLPENNTRIPDDNEEVVYKSLFDKNSRHNYKKDPESGKLVPNKVSLRKAWNLQRNEWLAQHVERKYLPKYYEAYAGLSEQTLEAINNIRDRINELKAKVPKDKNGHYLFSAKDEKGNYIFSEEDWQTLNGLFIERRALSSFININGTRKLENTPEYEIAKELQELNSELYDKDRDYHDKEAWAEERERIKREAIEKYTSEDGSVDENGIKLVLKEWDKRNSRRKLKKDAEDKAIIYRKIDEDLYEVTKLKEPPVFPYKGDGGARYKENLKRISDTLNIFRDSNTGEVNLNFLPASVKQRVHELESENYKIRTNAINNNEDLAKRWAEYSSAKRKIYEKYFVSTATDYWLAEYETEDDQLDISIDEDDDEWLPRWATKLIIREEFLDEYTELVPGDGWITTKDRDDLLNPEYERLSKIEGNENMSMIPKQTLYDNSEAFDKILNSETLKNLYDAILLTMKEANLLFYNNDKIDPYRLPQITGSMFTYMKATGKSGAWKYMLEQLGYVGDGQGLILDNSFGMAISSILDNDKEFSQEVLKNCDISVSKTKGERADGRLFNIIPPRYTTPLDDPSLISPDLIGIVCEYYDSAMNTKYKDEIKDTIESFMDMLSNRDFTKYKKDKDGKPSKRVVHGKDTRTYKSARKAVDMFLYGIQLDETGDVGKWNINKTAKLVKQATTAINLGASPIVALTGFFTSSFAHTVNSLVGDKAYGFSEAKSAAWISLKHWIKTCFGLRTVSNSRSTDKVKALMEMFNLVNQQEVKYKKSNQNRALRTISNNYIFGALTQLDYVIKSNIALSLALSHRYVDGQFVSKEDIKNSARMDSDEELAKKLKKWNEGLSVWDILEVDTDKSSQNYGKLIPKKEYSEAFEQCENLLYNRIIKCAEGADGIATETQKAAISTNFLGAAVLIHRQYLPLQVQDRFSNIVYDMDTLLYRQGMFRTVANALGFFIFKSMRDAYFAQKADADYHWYSMFTLNKDFYRDIMFNKKFHKNVAKNLLDFYGDYFGDVKIKNKTIIKGSDRIKLSDELYKLSRIRKKHMKRFAIELLMYHSIFKILLPLLLFAEADDKKNRDKLLLQFGAYLARRVLWESFNPYRFDDMIANIKTVTAETSLLDKVEAVLYHSWSRDNLFSTLFNSDKSSNDIVQRGVYKGWDKRDKALFKLFIPYHNAFEQIYGSIDKRRYYENQIMQLEK